MRYVMKGSFGQYSVVRDGETVARLDKRLMTEKASVEITGEPWEFGKESGGIRTAVSPRHPVLTAQRVTFWRGAWEVRGDSATYRLKPVGFTASKYEVLSGDRLIGTSGRASFWTNRPFVDLPGDVPVPEAVFMLWIAFLMRARAGAAAAASAS